MKNPMQKRLWITYILLFVTPIIFMATVGYAFLSRVMIDKTRLEYQTLLNHNATSLENSIGRLGYLSNQFRRTFWIEKIVNLQGDTLDPARVSRFDLIQYNQYIVACRESLPLVGELGIYFPRKDLVIATHGNSDFNFLTNNAMYVEGFTSSDWQYLLDNLNLGVPLIKPRVTIQRYGVAHEKMLYLERIQPIRSQRPDAIIFATIRISEIERLLQAISMNGQNGISITDTNGNIFASAGAEVTEAAVTLTYVSANTGWTHTLQIPETVILREITQIRNLMLLFTTGLLLVCSILSFAFSKSMQDELSKNLNRQRARLKDSYLGMILTGDASESSHILKELADMGSHLDRVYFQAAFLTRQTNSSAALAPLEPQKLEAILEESFVNAIAFARLAPSGCMLLFNYNTKQDLNELCALLLDQVPNAVLALGGETSKPDEISKSCMQAITVSQYRCFAEGYKLIRYEDHASKMSLYYYPFEMEYSLSALLSTRNGDEAMLLIDKLLDENIQREDVAPDGVRNFLVNITMNIARTVSDHQNFEPLPVTQLTTMSTEELQAYVQKAVRTICDSKPDISKNLLLFIRMQEYADTSLRNPDLSLNLMADAFGVSPSFVSKLFKEKGEKNFHQYVNEKRIDLAKPLLSDTKLTVLDVARQVGYESDITFRRQFKQFTGITPSVFRVNLQI